MAVGAGGDVGSGGDSGTPIQDTAHGAAAPVQPPDAASAQGVGLVACVKCLVMLRVGAKFCDACGTLQEVGQCRTCAAAPRVGAKFCDNCGASQVPHTDPAATAPGEDVAVPQPSSPPDATAAAGAEVDCRGIDGSDDTVRASATPEAAASGAGRTRGAAAGGDARVPPTRTAQECAERATGGDERASSGAHDEADFHVAANPDVHAADDSRVAVDADGHGGSEDDYSGNSDNYTAYPDDPSLAPTIVAMPEIYDRALSARAACGSIKDKIETWKVKPTVVQEQTPVRTGPVAPEIAPTLVRTS